MSDIYSLPDAVPCEPAVDAVAELAEADTDLAAEMIAVTGQYSAVQLFDLRRALTADDDDDGDDFEVEDTHELVLPRRESARRG